MKHDNSAFNIQYSIVTVFCLAVFSVLAGYCPFTAAAEEKAVLKGRVIDAEGKSLKGAIVLVYDSPEVRRRADFMSVRTEADGRFSMVLFPGKYWAIARLKKAAEYGPLMPGDKHSGEPREVEVAAGAERELDFTVIDIKASANPKKVREDYIKIKGKIVDEKGRPVKNAYAFASRSETFSGVPDYLSAWTDEEGRYTLYLPRGKYYLGAETAFPPPKGLFVKRTITVESEKSDVDIVSK